MDKRRLDINADVGELSDGGRTDAALMAHITSANIACGGHVGDAKSMRRACVSASENQVTIGAQVSFVDRANFGRARVEVPAGLLARQLLDQLNSLQEQANMADTTVRYIKPHGALYHACVADPGVAEVVGELAATQQLSVLTMPYGALRQWCVSQRVRVYKEAFIDRGYLPDGSLLPREHPGSLLDCEQVSQRLRTWHGSDYLSADSLCLHSDTPGALTIAETTRKFLASHHVPIGAFAAIDAIEV